MLVSLAVSSANEVAGRLRTILKNQLYLDMPVEQVPLDRELTDLGLSSAGAIALILSIEREFELRLPDEHINPETFRTGDSLAGVLKDLLDGPSPTHGPRSHAD